MPAEGTVLRLLVSRKPAPGDVYALNPARLVSAEQPGELPSGFDLSQNYPNPFNPTTGIRYQVSGVSDVRLSVYDILGREVATLVNERKQPGTYTVEFDASKCASGVYFYRLEALPNSPGSKRFVETRKRLLIR